MTRRRFPGRRIAHAASAPRTSFSGLACGIHAALRNHAGRALLTTSAGCILLATGLAVAGTFTVTTLADTDDGTCDADCSLREAIAAANASGGADVVDATGVTGTITLGGTEIGISGTDDLAITGPGADRLTVDANALSRIFHSTASGTLTLEGLTLANGASADYGGALYSYGTQLVLDDVTIRDSHAGADGGAIFASAGDLLATGSRIHDNASDDFSGGFQVDGAATLIDSIVSGNTAGDFAGGFTVYDRVVLRRSTISGNRSGLDPGADFGSAGGGFSYASITADNSTIGNNVAATYAGGLWAYEGITLHHTTVTGNSAVGGSGGGLYADETTDPIVLVNSIVAENDAGAGAPDIAGGSVASGYSLVGVAPPGFTDTGGSLAGTLANPLDPGLGPLAMNGGPTPTREPLDGSPAVDAGDPAFEPPPDFDQRGAPHVRRYGGRLDMGAVERQPGDMLFANGFELPPPQTSTFAADNLPLDLGAPGTYEATIPVDASGIVAKVEITFRFDLPFAGANQIEAILVAPNGDSIELFPSGVCGGGTAALLGPYSFRDDPVPDQSWPPRPCPAPGIVTPGQFKPFDPDLRFADAFNGDPASGTWLLRLIIAPAGSPGTSLAEADLRLGVVAR